MTGPRLNASNPIVESNGTMTQQFRNWTMDASLSIPIIGSGSPEGVVPARQFSLYIDSTGAPGSIEYRKILPDIAGDVTQGWRLV
ncbi:hypothetical protein UFOVP412_24 [uncultured Caudovirales phage]|uniref:Uncharacterized protein n=1 Tax=uncultured Caudovirales phage TaxID=2100421 RepID=A0A6J5M3C3_9CAUD|nr:hypothetical protein UFOVP412_24 [uncultured Caudovirales phage]